MSRYTTIRDAIAEAIGIGDPTCPTGTIHKRWRMPKLPSDDKLWELFGETLDDNTKRMHGWMFSRVSPSVGSEVANTQKGILRSLDENWELYGYLTFNDENDTESVFQEISDAVENALLSAPAILSLRENTCYVSSINIPVLDRATMAGQQVCHYVRMIITFTYPNLVN